MEVNRLLVPTSLPHVSRLLFSIKHSLAASCIATIVINQSMYRVGAGSFDSGGQAQGDKHLLRFGAIHLRCSTGPKLDLCVPDLNLVAIPDDYRETMFFIGSAPRNDYADGEPDGSRLRKISHT